MHWLVLAQDNLPGGGGVPVAPASGDGGGSVAAPAAGGGMESLILIGVMLVVFYFLLIRPQQKRAKKHTNLIESLKRGDEVITSSGIFGKIALIEGNTVTLEIAKNTKIKVLKNYVGGIANSETEKELAQQPQA